jgi:hypothetical protein
MECLVTLAIIAVIAGIVYTAMAPAREKAREAQCTSNLHQIWLATQMYRHDYGGQDLPAALTAVQLGLPGLPTLLQPYVRNESIFKCPSENWGPGWASNGRVHTTSYIWNMGSGEPGFSQVVNRRGGETPLVADPHHGGIFRGYDRGAGDWQFKQHKLLVLRLSGQVKVSHASPDSSSTDW